MHSYDELVSYFKKKLLEQKFEKSPDELYKPIQYCLSFGGKRMRPVMTLMACELFGEQYEKALPQAIAIELFHNFTLIHDDIMDKAELRRGKTTVYKKWNSNIAILAGDTLFALAYQYAIQAETHLLPKILPLFNKTAVEVCEGQQFDLNYETRNDVSLDEYIKMIKLKTAVLFATSLKIGAVIGSASETDAQRLYDFGINLGLGFQLQDDLLDTFGNEKIFGKKTGGDIVTNKKTYLYLYALQNATETDRKQLIKLYSEENKIPEKEKIEKVTAIFNRVGVKEAVQKVINDYLGRGLDLLNSLDVPRDNLKPLISVADKMIFRDK
jgi:geranylgeranyl diphosphate synthase type II